jgi:hypothetical protein
MLSHEIMTVRILEKILIALWLIAATAGCVTRNDFIAPTVLPDDGSHQLAFLQAESTIKTLFPAQYRATHRAVVTAKGRQFTCDGLLTVSPAEGHHLALVSTFGLVTDLRVKPDGATELLRVTPLFREDWARNYVARDLRWLFVSPAILSPLGRLANGQVVLQSATEADGTVAKYFFSYNGSRWLRLELEHGGKVFYRATVKSYARVSGHAAEIPAEIEVLAESYRLELRVVALKQEAQP